MLDLGGTLRATTAAESIARVEPMLLDQFGITRVVDVTGLDNIGLPVFMAIRPTAKSLSVSQGKGVTKDLAKISAIMESIELWHAENMPQSTLYGSYYQLQPHYPMCDIEKIYNSMQHGYKGDIFALEMNWIAGKELNSNREIFVPYDCVKLDYSNIRRTKSFLTPNSNGLASGNTLEEATCHALFEAIERDSDIEENMTDQSMIDLSTLSHPILKKITQQVLATGATLLVEQLPSRVGMPVYRCAIDDRHLARWTGTFGGSGAHLSHDIAAMRAITEAIQSRLTVISGARDDMFPICYNKMRNPTPFSHSAGCIPMRSSESMPSSFAECIKKTLSMLNQQSFTQVIRIDLTRPPFNIPVVHITVPGLRLEHLRHCHA